MHGPIITLTTDFGVQDHYVAAMRGVLLTHCPAARLVDITHSIAPQDVHAAAWSLAQAVDWFPDGTVHLVVVDPGVGSSRHILAGCWGRARVVAPDNGVVTFLEQRHAGGVCHRADDAAVAAAASTTFHGRDLMAPIAARLATGGSLAAVGPRVRQPVTLSTLAPAVESAEGWRGQVIHIDYYGNLVTNLPASAWGTGQITIAGQEMDARWGHAYADVSVGETVVLSGSAGMLEVSVRNGHAARSHAVSRGAAVTLVRTAEAAPGG